MSETKFTASIERQNQKIQSDIASITRPISKSNNSIPAGLECLYSTCHKLYPDQLNPLQVTAVIKYWLGGPDPLDYISMFYNSGNEEIPPHWHYVSFGLSDLHGDGRVHEVTGPDQPSGFGFELTMRVCCEEGEKSPPTWPAALMQGLAKYIFQSDSVFCVGDHISWHNSLDNSESRIQHMLISEEPQLGKQNTPFGSVQFVQIVGVTVEELEAAQHWNGNGILEIMKRFPETGRDWLITNMKRGESIFDLDPSVAEEVENGISKDGSNLSGVAAQIMWSIYDDFSHTSDENKEDVIDSEKTYCTDSQLRDSSSTLVKELEYRIEKPGDLTQSTDTILESETFVQEFPSLHLIINYEAGSLLPLALRGRLKHGRHFTFKSRDSCNAVTLVSPAVEGAFSTSESPFALKGPWLQVYIEEDFLDEMIDDLASLTDSADETEFPLGYEWSERKLKITIISDEH